MGKSVAVLGLGKYGKSLAENLYMMGADVLAVDKDKELSKIREPCCCHYERCSCKRKRRSPYSCKNLLRQDVIYSTEDRCR